MVLNFYSFSSGSSGNCYLVKSKEAAILIDAGISGRKILQSLESTRTSPAELDALLISHEHYDHVRSLKTVSRKIPQMRVFANSGTWEPIEALVDESKRAVFETGKSFWIKDVEVMPFAVSHDAAEPVGFSLRSEGKQISILTDTGCLDKNIYDEIKNADLLILEANHDVEMLKMGRYPYFVKQRILSSLGHLSNTDAANAIAKLHSEEKKERHILLAHLSKENNFPEMAYLTIKNLLEEKNHRIGAGLRVNIISRDELSALYTI